MKCIWALSPRRHVLGLGDSIVLMNILLESCDFEALRATFPGAAVWIKLDKVIFVDSNFIIHYFVLYGCVVVSVFQVVPI